MADFTFDLLNEKGTPVIYSLGQTAGEGQSLTLTVKSPATAWQPGAGEPSLANCHFAICFQPGLLFTDAAGSGAVPTLDPPETSSTDEWLISGLLTHPDDGSDCFCVLRQGSAADPGAEHSFQLSGITVEDGMITQHVRTLLRIGTVGENGQPLFDTTPAQTIVQQLLTVEEDYPYDLSDIGSVSDTIDQKIEAFRVSDHGFLTSDDLPDFITQHTSPIQDQIDQIETDADDLETKLMGKITALDTHEDHQVDLILGGMGETDILMTVLRDKTIPPLQARIKEGSAGWNFLQVGKESTITIQISPNPDFFNLHTEPGATTNPAKIKAKSGATVSIDTSYFDNLKIGAVRSPWSLSTTQKNIASLPSLPANLTDTLETARPLELTVTLTPKGSTQIHLVPLVITCGNFAYKKLNKNTPPKAPRPDLTADPVPDPVPDPVLDPVPVPDPVPDPVLDPVSVPVPVPDLVPTPASLTPPPHYSFTEDAPFETLVLHIPLYLGPLHVSPGLVAIGNVATGGAANLGVFGKVGIGTASPEGALHINTDGLADTATGFRMGKKGKFVIDADGTTGGRMTVLNNGNVGIGTNTPTAKLQIGEKILRDWRYEDPDTQLVINSANENGGKPTISMLRMIREGNVADNTQGNQVDFRLGKYNGSNAYTQFDIYLGNDIFQPQRVMTMLSNGNVGIGTTTPKSKLDVGGGVTIGATYAGANTAPNNGAIIEGNVGIGTADVDAKLKVNGDVKITGSLQADWRMEDYSDSATLKANSTSLSGDRLGYALSQSRTSGMTSLNSPLQIDFTIRGNPKMWLANNGNLNIGQPLTTEIGERIPPTTQLQVTGDAKITGKLQVVNSIKIGNTEILESDLILLKKLTSNTLVVALINTKHEEVLFASNSRINFAEKNYRMVATWMTKNDQSLDNAKWKLVLY